jgi:hypothetical protein
MARNGTRRGTDAFLLASASGKSVIDAAGEAGISLRTAQRRRAEPSFRQELATLRGEMIERALGRLSDSMSAAADKLRQLLSANSEQVQLGAARSLLELGTKLRDSVELEARVADLGLSAQPCSAGTRSSN